MGSVNTEEEKAERRRGEKEGESCPPTWFSQAPASEGTPGTTPRSHPSADGTGRESPHGTRVGLWLSGLWEWDKGSVGVAVGEGRVGAAVG